MNDTPTGTAIATRQPRDAILDAADRFGVSRKEVWNVIKATAFRNIKDPSNADVLAFMIVADQHRLNPFTREIYAFQDVVTKAIVPIVGVDGWIRIINEHPQFDGMELRYSSEMVQDEDDTEHKGKPLHHPAHAWIECIIYRKDRTRPTVIREDFDEVYRGPRWKEASSWNGKPKPAGWTKPGPWQTNTKRFHRHRAIIQAARVAFGFASLPADETDALDFTQSETGTWSAPPPEDDRPIIDVKATPVADTGGDQGDGDDGDFPEVGEDDPGTGGTPRLDLLMVYDADGKETAPVNATTAIIRIEAMIEGKPPQVVAAVLTANADTIHELGALEYAAAGIFADKLAKAEAALAAPPPPAKAKAQAKPAPKSGPVPSSELGLSPEDVAEHDRISRRIGKAENAAELAATWKFEQEAIKLLPESARANLQRVHDVRF